MLRKRSRGRSRLVSSLFAASALVTSALFAFPSAGEASPGTGQGAATIHFYVNTTEGQTPISSMIYGINLDDSLDPSQFAAVMAEARPGLIRMGGNRWTAFNWENNDSNAGSDYEYENDDFLSSSTTPGAAVLATVKAARTAGIPILLTIPIAGYVSADRNPPGPVQNSGPNYLETRFDLDEPTDPNPLSVTPDLTDHVVYQDQFVYWLEQTVPGADIMLSLDNEPDLWDSTHAEIHAAQTTYSELLSKTLEYAAAVKKVDPAALVTGPVSYGWEGYLTLQDAPDSSKDGNFLDWYMRKIHAADAAKDTTLVNDLDLHWYPEATGGGVRITGTGTTPALVTAREQAPRSLWDKTYVENSWITQDSLGGKAINLIHRLKGQIKSSNPGMNLDFTEWNYGAGQDISGAIASADVLGLFGRYGVHAAALWPLNADESYNYGALATYRNYDGKGAGFGDTEVHATTTDTVNSSIYASIDQASPNHLVLVVINKALSPTTSSIRLSGVTASTATVYTLTSASATPQAAPSITASPGGTFAYTMPAQSISVIVPAASARR